MRHLVEVFLYQLDATVMGLDILNALCPRAEHTDNIAEVDSTFVISMSVK